MKLLITGATGMFGGALVKQLTAVEKRGSIHALVRNLQKAEEKGLNQIKNLKLVEGDLKKPDTLLPALEGVERVFLVTPMVFDLDQMEINLIHAAKKCGVKQIFKLYGAVKHKGDRLIQLHDHALTTLKESGLAWTLISPNSVMETSLLPFAETIKQEHALYGCTGHHRMGLIALEDVIKVTAKLLTTPGHEGEEYRLTGPESLSLYDIAKCFSDCLQTEIRYLDMTEQEFEKLLMEFLHKSREQIDMEVMCHMRAWNQDGADFVTDTYEKVMGEKPKSIAAWIKEHFKLKALQ